MKKVRHIIEFAFFLSVYALMSAIPYKMSSFLMGKLFSILGPLLPVNRVAYKNLELAFPCMSNDKKREIVKKMWNNLGCIIGEFPRTFKLSHNQLEKNVKIQGFEHIVDFKKNKKGGIILTGHFGNWENSLAKITSLGFDMAVVYRKINNPYINNLVLRVRGGSNVEQIPKSVFAIKKIIAALKNSKLVCLLADQKQNNGIAANFFDYPVMTGSLPAKLAVERGVHLIPAMSVRNFNLGAKYNIYVEEPITVTKEDDIASVTLKINLFYQRWIKKYPEQWFWLHRRWPREYYKK